MGGGYSGTSGYSLSNNGNMAYISGDGISINPHAEKTFDVTNADFIHENKLYQKTLCDYLYKIV